MNFVKRLLTEITNFEHIVDSLFRQIFYGMDICSLQAVIRTNGQFHIFDALFEYLRRNVYRRRAKNIEIADRVGQFYEHVDMFFNDLRRKRDYLFAAREIISLPEKAPFVVTSKVSLSKLLL